MRRLILTIICFLPIIYCCDKKPSGQVLNCDSLTITFVNNLEKFEGLDNVGVDVTLEDVPTFHLNTG